MGSEFPCTVGHRAFELYPAKRQGGSGGAQRIADLIELSYPPINGPRGSPLK